MTSVHTTPSPSVPGNQATKKAQFAVDKLPRANPDQERDASRVIFDNLMVALKEIREQESKLWEKIPMTVEAGGDDLAEIKLDDLTEIPDYILDEYENSIVEYEFEPT